MLDMLQDAGAGRACARVRECASTHPQPLRLPTPGPHKAYHGDCTEYRPIPGRGPADNPASHRGEVIYTGDCQINHNQEERIPPVEECAPPGACQRTRGVRTSIARTLLLCTLAIRSILYAAWCPKSHRLHH